ncbi:hypothetical protein [Streptomyces sp. NPDC058418]
MLSTTIPTDSAPAHRRGPGPEPEPERGPLEPARPRAGTGPEGAVAPCAV